MQLNVIKNKFVLVKIIICIHDRTNLLLLKIVDNIIVQYIVLSMIVICH